MTLRPAPDTMCYLNQAAGWRARAEGGGEDTAGWTPHTVVTFTPTGHEYRSTAPPVLPGTAPDETTSPLERAYTRLLAA